MTAPPGGFPPGFEWDDDKNEANVRKHGIFDQPTLDRIDDRREYGEVRTNSVGDLGRLIVATVTHTDRGGVVRLMSARAASSAGREAYRAFEQQRRRSP